MSSYKDHDDKEEHVLSFWRQTEKAILVSEGDTKDGAVWLPKSQIEWDWVDEEATPRVISVEMPEWLVEPCILAGCPEGGIILDPFMGSGTVAVVAEKHGRDWIGIELNPEYCEIAAKRISNAKCRGWQQKMFREI